MTPRIAPNSGHTGANHRGWLARHARTALGGVIVAGAAVLAVGAAAILAVAAVTVVAILAAVGLMLYLFARVRFRKPVPAAAQYSTSPAAARTLEARRTGAGWTVDALGRFGG